MHRSPQQPTHETWETVPSVGPRSWHNKTAVICSIYRYLASSCSNTVCYQQEPEYKKYQKTAAWTSFPLTEGEPVRSADLCNLLHMPSMLRNAVDVLFQKILAEFGAF